MVRKLGMVTAVAAMMLTGGALSAHADTDVLSHAEGNLRPGQEICIADQGIKAVANSTATNGGARFRVNYKGVLQFDSGAGSLGIVTRQFDLGQGRYELCGKNPNSAKTDTFVTLDLVVTRRP